MMEEKKTIFDYLAQMMILYGCTVLIFILFGVLIGEEARELSTLFALGGNGIAYSSLIQLFVMMIFITGFQFLFFSDAVIKNMGLVKRIVCMLIAVIATVVIFVLIFDWFPVSEAKAWIGFALSFGVCFCISVGVISLKEKTENREMEEALRRMNEKDDK